MNGRMGAMLVSAGDTEREELVWVGGNC